MALLAAVETYHFRLWLLLESWFRGCTRQGDGSCASRIGCHSDRFILDHAGRHQFGHYHGAQSERLNQRIIFAW